MSMTEKLNCFGLDGVNIYSRLPLKPDWILLILVSITFLKQYLDLNKCAFGL